MFFALLFSVFSSTLKTICIADDKSQCKLDVEFEFVQTSSLKESIFYQSATLDVHIYSQTASVSIQLQRIKGDISIYGHVTNNNFDITLESSLLIRPDYQISLHNIKAALKDQAIYVKNLLLDNSELVSKVKGKANEVSIYAEKLISDTNSLVNAVKVLVNEFSLTEIQDKLNKNIDIDIAFSFTKESVINILGDATNKLQASLKRREIDIKSGSNNNYVQIKSILALPKVNFEKIKNDVEIIRGGFLNAIEMFHFNFELEGGKLRFPEDIWPLSLTLQSFFTGSVFQIQQKIASTIELGAQRLPASIKNSGSDPLDIKAIAQKCGITGKLELSNALDKIRTDLNEKIDFAVQNIEKLNDQAKLISDKAMQIISELDIKEAISDTIRNVVEEIEVKKQQITEKVFNLADNGHLQLAFDIDLNGQFSSGKIVFEGDVKLDKNGRFTIDLEGGISGALEDYPFEKLKQLIGKPQNLVCSKVSIKLDDWLLNTVNENLEDVLRLQYADTSDGLHCIQLVLTKLPRMMSEKYCIGNKCPEGYTVINKDSIMELKDKVHEKTEKVQLQLQEALDTSHSIEFSAFNGNVSFSIEGNSQDLSIDLDLTVKDHIASLDISKSNLNFNIQNKESNNYLEVNVPSLSLNDIKVNGQLKDKKISFTGDVVKTDLSTFNQLVEAKFNSLVLDLENTEIFDTKVKKISIDKDGYINFTGGLTNKKISSVNLANVAKDLAIKFNTGTISDLDINIDSNVKSTKGFKLDIHGDRITKQQINFDTNWGGISNYGAGITIARDADIVLENVPDNMDLTFEGSGSIEIHLKAGSHEFKINRKYEVTSATKFKINNDVIFADLQFSGKANFEVEHQSTSSKLLANDNKVVVEKATLNEGSEVELDDLIVKEQLTLNPGSSLVANSITFEKNSPLVINYQFGSFPSIQAKSKPGLTKPSKILVQFDLKKGDDLSKVNFDQYIGYANPIYCSDNETFTLDACNDYANLVSYSSDFKGLNGKSSAMQTRCIALPNSEDQQKVNVCLTSELSQSPDMSSSDGKKKSNAGLIAGVTIAVVVVVAAIIVVVVIVVKKRKQENKSENQLNSEIQEEA